MIIGLDSASPPSLAQAQAARAAGVGLWNGYIATRSGVGLYRAWSQGEFAVVQQAFPTQPIAFASGWDDPVAVRQLADAWGVRLCLDVEGGIRPDGPWVQGWLDASGAGLYGQCGVHAARQAPFHILAWYPGVDVGGTWYDAQCARPSGPVGWQWWNTHDEFGVAVDRGRYDDWFGGADDMTQDEHNTLMACAAVLAKLDGRVLGDIGAQNVGLGYLSTRVDDIHAAVGVPAPIDVKALAAALAPYLPSASNPLTVARAVADEFERRLRLAPLM